MPIRKSANTIRRRSKPVNLEAFPKILMSDLSVTNGEAKFRQEDFRFLSENEYGRYRINSKKVGHALINTELDGTITARQFSLPNAIDKDTPQVIQLTNFEKIYKLGRTTYKALGPNNRTWYAKRSEAIKITSNEQEISADLAYFSEEDEVGTDPFAKNNSKLTRFKQTRTEPIITKGGTDITIDRQSVIFRDQNSERSITQNEVKNKSAKNEAEDFLTQNSETISAELASHINFSINNKFWEQFYFQWLHVNAHSLTHEDIDPQVSDNLVSAPSWANTEMMVLERMAKWFSLNVTDCVVKINSLFELLASSELADRIYFQVIIEINNKLIRIIQDIDPLQKNPELRKASDVAQAVGVVHALANDAIPINTQKASQREWVPFDFQSFKTVPESFIPKSCSSTEQIYRATIIDLETMGLNYAEHEIIELALISFEFSKESGVLRITRTYSSFNDPGKLIPEEITNITEITNDDVAGKTIDWGIVYQEGSNADFIICHNVPFDRKFLEEQTPTEIQELFKSKPFACTLKDINWQAKGFNSSCTLKNLNLLFEYVFKGHRALNDCFATFNLLVVDKNNLIELLNNIQTKHMFLCVTKTPFEQRHLLFANNFQFFNGDGTKNKYWFKYLKPEEITATENWLNQKVYNEAGMSATLPRREVQAREKYSARIENATLFFPSKKSKRPTELELAQSNKEELKKPKKLRA